MIAIGITIISIMVLVITFLLGEVSGMARIMRSIKKQKQIL